MTPEMIGLVEKLIALASLVVSSYAAYVMLQVKKVVEPLPEAIDGAQDKMKELIAEINRLKGEKVGVAQEKADQALRETVPTPTNPTPNQQSSIPTAANPLVTVEKLEEVLKDQTPPTVIADRGEGWETPPLVQPDEIVRQKNRGE